VTLATFVALAGWSAAALILASYCLVSTGRIEARSPLYQWMNLCGALGFVVNCTWNGAWPAVALNSAWMVIAIWALRRNRKLGARQPPVAGSS
jgi:hypothetical protein